MPDPIRLLVSVFHPHATAALTVACRVCDTFGGRIVGLHGRADPSMVVPLMGEGMSGALVEEMLAQAQAQAQDRADRAHAAFTDTVAGRDHCWVETKGENGDDLARLGRLSDLLILDRQDEGDQMRGQPPLTTALMETGRPILVCPPTLPDLVTKGSLAKTIAIAWNGSAEAARAVACALPFLVRADAVHVLTVNGPQGQDLCDYLADHGVKAHHHALKSQGFDPHHAGPMLIEECSKLSVDMLVMGAFSHSRLRQMILGGVTRHVLSHCPIPCLMSH